jgi:cytidine deaminase
MLPLLTLAAEIALPTNDSDPRNFWLGCVGIRDDGVQVTAQNGAAHFTTSVENYQLVPNSHAEGRVLRKLGKCGVIFVARVSRKDRSLVMSQPCGMCQVRIKAAKVKKVYYTINDNQYGIWLPDSDTYRIYTVK